MKLPSSSQRTDQSDSIFVRVEKARLSHFQDTDYCIMAQKVPCACETDDMRKLTGASGNHHYLACVVGQDFYMLNKITLNHALWNPPVDILHCSSMQSSPLGSLSSAVVQFCILRAAGWKVMGRPAGVSHLSLSQEIISSSASSAARDHRIFYKYTGKEWTVNVVSISPFMTFFKSSFNLSYV